MLDNASDDGSAEAVRAARPDVRLIALERRAGQGGERLAAAARGRGPLLPAAERGLGARAGRRAGAAGRARGRPGRRGRRARSCSRARAARRPAPGACPTRAGRWPAALFAHRRYAVQSRGARVREVGWVQSSAMLVRREAAEAVGWLDPDFFVYSDETDFCRRLHDAGWRILFVPAARAVHHDQLSTDPAAMRRRIVEFHRGRDRYFRKHGMRRHAARVDASAGPGPTSSAPAAALALPGRDPRRYLLHARQQLHARPRRRAARGGRGVQPRACDAPLAGRLTGSTLSAPMEHADLAQIAAVCGALGSALVLLARERLALLGGLCCSALAEAGLVGSLGDGGLDKLSSAAGGAAALLGLACSWPPPRCCRAAPRGCRWPCWWPRRSGRRSTFAARTASSSRWRRTAGWAACCRSTSCWRPPAAGARLADAARRRGARAAARAGAARRGLPRVRLPVAAVGRRPGGRARTCSRSSRCRSRCCWPWSPGPSSRDWAPRALAVCGDRAGVDVRRRGRLAGDHPRAVLLRAQPGRLEREHGLLPRDLAVRRPEPLRPPPGARHRRRPHAAGHRPRARPDRCSPRWC